MVAPPAEPASTSVTHSAVGYRASVTAPRYRFTSLVRGLSGSFVSQLQTFWGDTPPVLPRRSNTAVSGTDTSYPPAQLTGSTPNVAAPQLPFIQPSTKASSPNISLSSRPVIVRTYTQVDRSRPASANPSSQAPPQSMTASANLPPVDAFSFDGILRAIEPDINEAIDGIAEIYARSKLSLADEYGSHLPPQGEIMAHRLRYSGLAIRTAGLERTLTTVTEASSSSERLAGGSKAGSVASGKGKVTAYGSLRSIISRGRSSSHSSVPAETPTRLQPLPASWGIMSDNESFITIKKQTAAPIQLSLASVAEVPRDKIATSLADAEANMEPTPSTPRRPASWLTWRRSLPMAGEELPSQRPDAESALKNILRGVGSS